MLNETNRTVKNRTRALIAVAALAGFATFAAPAARAALVLSYNSGATVITDNGAGDVDPAVGTISNNSTIAGFGVAITVGTSNTPGTATAGILQVQSLDVRNAGAGTATLNISLSDTGFTQPGGAGTTMRLTSDYGTTLTLGAVGNSTVFRSFADPANAQPATAFSTAALTATKSNALAVTEAYNGVNSTTFVRGAGAYSLANAISVTLSPGGQANISGTTTAQVLPEPASVAAIAGAVTLVTARRRRTA